ncbi:MAG: c-type cytochrome [Saprospiraceae bacterium]
MKRILAYSLLAIGFSTFVGCQGPDVNSTGAEYMPDMAHSIAYEANTYFEYYYNTWDSASVKAKYDLAQPGLPVKGTVPRGYASQYFAGVGAGEGAVAAQAEALAGVYGLTDNIQDISTPANGSVPYYYEDTEAARARAIADLRNNPFPITADGLARGKELYNIFCGICHGEKGDGNGVIYVNEAYPAAPANFLQESWVDTSSGAYYHAIMHGKNVMGNYRDKVSYEERWQIIHHIRTLQAKEFKKTYTDAENTLVPSQAMPAATNPQYAKAMEASFSSHHTAHDDGHGHEHGDAHDHSGDHEAHDDHGNDDHSDASHGASHDAGSHEGDH